MRIETLSDTTGSGISRSSGKLIFAVKDRRFSRLRSNVGYELGDKGEDGNEQQHDYDNSDRASPHVYSLYLWRIGLKRIFLFNPLDVVMVSQPLE
jgi:hypothetical protein